MHLRIQRAVHGDIRHLEISQLNQNRIAQVHGDIRHLEINIIINDIYILVHGDIRHLENQCKF